MSYAEPLALPPEHEPAPGWGQSLYAGAPGIALLHAEYARTGLGDRATVHRWAAAMTRSPVAAHSDASLFYGAPAVAYALRTVAHTTGDAVYAKAVAALDRHITALTEQRLDRAHDRIQRGHLPSLREFDLINGLTGIGVYLFCAARTDLLRKVLAYLVCLVEPIAVDGQRLPGWWTFNSPADQPSSAWPGGHANLSIAHGVCGPLALLSTMLRSGVTVPGQAEAIEHIDTWLEGWRCGELSQPWWPGVISRAEWITGTVKRPGPQRPSWCYGTPGLARARQLAAAALDEPQRQRQAEAALFACVTDDAQLAQLRDASLCHGWAGLVHTTWRAATDAGAGSELEGILPRLHDHWYQQCHAHRTRISDKQGLLEGMTGVALTQGTLDSANTGTPAGWWDTCLFTAPTISLHLEGIG